MLSRFTVGNFCSFDKNQTLSLIAGSIQNHKERLYQANDFKLLKFASIYGANAAGKSNFIKAMDYAQTAIIVGVENEYFEERKDNYFRLNPENKAKPSYFEFEICIDKSIYAYGFEMIINQKRITEEWLVKLNKTKDEIIFSRNSNTGSVYFNNDYLNDETKSRMAVYLEDFQKVTNKTFLSEIISNKAELYKNNEKLQILKDVHKWVFSLNISYPDTSITGYDCFSEENINELINAIEIFKTGISRVIPTVISKEQALDKIRPEFRKEVEEAIQRTCPKENTETVKDSETCGFRLNINGRLIFVTFKDRESVFTEITFEHFGIKDVRFSLAEESNGTQRLLDLLSILFTQKENSVFIIDEIDQSLHPQLTRKFIENFLHYAKKKNIQLIISTHESHLLNLDLVRQDEIFFVESTPTGDSVLYPFDRFKERFDKKIEKAYLDGRYGGVPIFDSIFFPKDDIE
ncbi:MAG: ATP-binding protein [Treponema bryantii]|nr:ATP-binding protein [Treponema bryantii]